jgi:Mrp family chromosome partitioning ATPase/capsular polysaccharide biosynthesis protein
MANTTVFGALRRRWWIILLLASSGAALGAIPAPAKVAEESVLVTYEATHTMLLNGEEANSNVGSTGVSPNQVALLATVGEVPDRVAAQIGFEGAPAALASEVTVTFDYLTGALTFTTTQANADRAELIADTFATTTNSYLIERQDEVYQERVAASIDRLAKLEKQLEDLTAQLGVDAKDPVLIAQRDAASRRYSVAFEQSETLAANQSLLSFTTLATAQALPIEQGGGGFSAPKSRTTRGLLGLVAGTGVGFGVVLLLSFFDRRVRTREQAEAILGMRARVMIPTVKTDHRGVVVRNGRHDTLSDSYRTLRNVVAFVQGGLEPVSRARVTIVVSPGPGEGKTSVAANLAAAFVEFGLRTIVVNTDFRRPRLAEAVTAGRRHYLPFTLQELDGLDVEQLLTQTLDPNLSMLDLSSLGSAGELARATVRLLPRLTELADAIVIDTSPVGATAEVLELIPFADVIVVVAKIGVTQIETADRSIAILRDLTTAPMVLALTGAPPERSTYYEYADPRKPHVPAMLRSSATGWRDRFRRDKRTEPRHNPRGPKRGSAEDLLATSATQTTSSSIAEPEPTLAELGVDLVDLDFANFEQSSGDRGPSGKRD